MTIKIPSKKSVVRAGDILRTADPDSDEYIDAIQILSDWRSLYAYPLNAFNGLLLQKCNSLGLKGKSIVALSCLPLTMFDAFMRAFLRLTWRTKR